VIFLIQYNRANGRIVRFEEFQDAERETAANERLEIELDLNRKGIEHDVLLLEALSQEALRRTHRRFFEDVSEIAST
jgi:hypothetical protein